MFTLFFHLNYSFISFVFLITKEHNEESKKGNI